MIIEALVPDPRRPGSTRVIVDGRPAWTVPADVVAALGLAPARPLPAGGVAALDAAADEEAAFRAAIKAKGLTNLCVPREVVPVKEIPKLGTGKVNHRELAKQLPASA